jgi:pimeloyl-ACP methyl ester carboxylesterase
MSAAASVRPSAVTVFPPISPVSHLCWLPRRVTLARVCGRLSASSLSGCWLAGASAGGGLALDMNAVIIGNNVPETEGATGMDAWHHLAEIKVPVTVAGGDLDVPFLVDSCRLLADRLPAAKHRVLAGMAHQPYLESAAAVAQLIRSAVTDN